MKSLLVLVALVVAVHAQPISQESDLGAVPKIDQDLPLIRHKRRWPSTTTILKTGENIYRLGNAAQNNMVENTVVQQRRQFEMQRDRQMATNAPNFGNNFAQQARNNNRFDSWRNEVLPRHRELMK